MWVEYVDTGSAMTREEFDATSEFAKIRIMVDLFGRETDESGEPVPAAQVLLAARDAYDGDTGPGYWTVGTATAKGGLSGTSLTYVAAAGCEVTDPGQPWRQWGGEAIIAAAGLTIMDGIDDSDGSTYFASAIVD